MLVKTGEEREPQGRRHKDEPVQGTDRMEHWQSGEVFRVKPVPVPRFSTTDPTWTDPGSNPSLPNNFLSHGTANNFKLR